MKPVKVFEVNQRLDLIRKQIGIEMDAFVWDQLWLHMCWKVRDRIKDEIIIVD